MTAASAEIGIELLNAYGPVHVVISDFRMPGMNGVEFLRVVHKNWPNTVGILVSGYAELPAVNTALDERFIHRHLPKPWDRSELREAVMEALDCLG